MVRLLSGIGLTFLLLCSPAAWPSDLLTPTERAWLDAHPSIRLGVGAEWAPWVIQTPDGGLTGFAADHLSLLGDKLGIRIGLEAGPWHEVVAAAEAGRLDGLTLAAALPERREHFLFTDDFHSVHLFLYLRDGDALPQPGLAGLAGRRVGYLQDVLRERKLLATDPSIAAVPLASLSALSDALLTGKVDAVVAVYSLEYWRASNGVLGFAPRRMLPESPARLGISVRKDWPELVGILNKGLAAITPDEAAALNRRWFGRGALPTSEPPQTALSAEERAWIAAHPVVRFGIDPAWAPVEFRDEQGRPQGISVAYLRALERQLGLRFELVETGSWSETLGQLEAGALDLLPAVAVTPDRQARFHLTAPYVSFPAAIFSAEDVAYLGDITALASKTVAVIADESVHEWLRDQHPEIPLLTVPDTRTALRAVARGEAFAFVGNLATTSYYIGAAGLSQIKVLGETPFVYRLGMAVHRDQPVLAGLIQKGLDAIPRHARDAIYHDWVSIRYSHGTDLGLLWRVIGGAALLLAVSGWWTLRLNREVARRRQAETALRKAKEAAEQANLAKSAFLANTSHELRTPLNLVLGFASLLQGARLGGREQGWIEAIGTAGRSLAHLIEDLLDLSRIEAGRLDLKPNAIDPRALLQELAVIFGQRAAEKGLTLRVRIADGVPAALVLDEARVRQILVNLLGNAIKFTRAGGIELGVTAKQTATGRWRLRLSVTDTGPGIPEAEQQAIFDPFVQGAGSPAAGGTGAGLGLAISRGLAVLMGGDIRLQSAPVQGSTFVLDLLEVAEAPAPAVAVESGQPLAAVWSAPGLDPLPILIADDQAENRALLREFLSGLPLEPIEATDGAEALELACARQPGLILMDVAMPGMDGLEATRRLKASPATAGIPVLAVTAAATTDQDAKLRQVFDAVLHKPLARADLLAALAHWLPLRPGLPAVTGAAAQSAQPEPRVPLRLPRGLAERLRTIQPYLSSMNEIAAFAADLRTAAETSGDAWLRWQASDLSAAAEGFDLAALARRLDALQRRTALWEAAGETPGEAAGKPGGVAV